jgi:hypothetical protein
MHGNSLGTLDVPYWRTEPADQGHPEPRIAEYQGTPGSGRYRTLRSDWLSRRA